MIITAQGDWKSAVEVVDIPCVDSIECQLGVWGSLYYRAVNKKISSRFNGNNSCRDRISRAQHNIFVHAIHAWMAQNDDDDDEYCCSSLPVRIESL